MRKRKSLKPLLKTCPGRDDGTSSAEGESATDEDGDSFVDSRAPYGDDKASDDGRENAGDSNVRRTVEEALTRNQSVFDEANAESAFDEERGSNGSPSILAATAFVKASDLKNSNDSSEVQEARASTSSTFPRRGSAENDRFALKANVVSLVRPAARKSGKRKLKPSEEDGRKQTSISSFFGLSSKAKDSKVAETAGSVSPARPAPTPSSTSSSPEKYSRGSQSQEIKVSTLDGFVSISPRKNDAASSSSLIADDSETSSTFSSTTVISKAKRQRRTVDPRSRPTSSSLSSSASPSVGRGSSDSRGTGPSNPETTKPVIDQKPSGIDGLPEEILETIFCQIPHGDLALHMTRVCRKWRDIISSASFMPHKKLYYAYKKTSGEHFERARNEIFNMMAESGMESVGTCFLGFIRRMKTFIPSNAGGSSPRIMSVLKKMPRYEKVKLLFPEQEGLQDCLEINNAVNPSLSEPSPLCALAAMFVLSQEVDETSSLLRHLLAAGDIPLHLILELFYAAATFFLAFHRRYKIPDKHHYIIFTAIYFYENKMQVDRETLNRLFADRSAGQQSLVRFVANDRFLRLTHEQFRIIANDIKQGEVIKINAFAGTGKTTTLIQYTEVRPSLKFLYIAYNKAIKLDAEKRFPSTNVVCRTMHSIAFKFKGWLYAKNNKIGNLKTRAVLEVLEKIKGFDLNLRASLAIRTVDNFVASNDREILLAHVPETNDHGPIKAEYRDRHLLDARSIWEKMKDEIDSSVPMTHDGYLKLYQLKWKPDFDHTLKDTFNVLLIDEAQDLTPACIDILTQQAAPKILVGDPNQQIYSFRGAVNAMSLVQGTSIHYLTQSFRFGPQIAHLCDTLLGGMKGVDSRTIIGNQKNCLTLGGVVGQLCIISRSNFRQFVEAVHATDPARASYWNDKENDGRNEEEGGSQGKGKGNGLSKSRSIGTRPTIAFTGQDKEDFLLQVMDVYRLHERDFVNIRDPFIKRFESFQKYANYAKTVSDFDILGKCQIVKVYGRSTEKHVDRIRRHMTKRIETADLVLTTAHKAKGLEFDTVKLSDDFLPMLDSVNLPQLQTCDEDEKNILYVAVSRAKKSLIMNETLIQLLWLFGAPFASIGPNPLYSTPDPNVPTHSSTATRIACIVSQCDATVPVDNAWTVRRPSVSIKLPYESRDGHNSVDEGSFCRKHGGMVMPAFAPFLKVPRNRPKPKEKIRFSFAANVEENADVDREEDEVDEHRTRSFDHLDPAFRRPRDDHETGDAQGVDLGLLGVLIVL